MNMTDYLKDFFAEDASRKAAVPGLGVFYAEEGADGRYRILFEEVAPKGKEFINHVAFRMNATEQEAVEKLDEWVKSILKSLKSIKVATLPGIGTFEVSDDRVNFLPSAEQDKEDRFGLEPMTPAAPAVAEDAEDVATPADLDEETRFADEMEQTEQLTGEHHKEERKKRQAMLMWIGIGGCIVILLAALLLVFKPFSGMTGGEAAVIEDIILGEAERPEVAEPVEVSVPCAKIHEDEEIEQAFLAGERERKAAEAQARQEQAAKPAPKPAAKPAPAPKPAAKPAPKPA
ncbi:MAG: HU family DNA-binding protein, partial [Bacteroidales bacterium]|nr:HU family DNA-binding protein [Bacteroidales bacterium]